MLGNFLKTTRLERNISQGEMAKSIGTSQSYYSLIESGRRKPGYKLINRIANYLNVQPSFIRSLL